MKKILTMIITILLFSLLACIENPTTLETTSLPTTHESITEEQTSMETRTQEPTSIEPTTDIPTTVQPTTELPTTQAPTTVEPTTEIPTTSSPTTEAPTSQIPVGDSSFKPDGYSLLQDELDSIGIPSIGDVKVLVFAIDFPDQPVTENDPSVAEIDLVFNGSSNDLAFESVNSYYLKSSYEHLNLTADVFGYYTMSQTSSFYKTENDKFYETDPITGEYVYGDDEVIHVESDIIDELLAYYDNQIDYSQYDANQDGLIDGIYLVYNHPSDGDSDLWWAYQYNYFNTSTYDGVSPNYYMWASNDFLYEGEDALNARTFIHETGHMMGLDDYYDYYTEDTINEGGLGAYMMDYNEGDHDPFSKLLLGWIQPIVVESSSELSILPHMESGDVILLIDEWNGTIFDEYLLISYYTPDDLNTSNFDVMFTNSGINIFHVSAQIGQGYLDDSYYYTIFNYNNTDTDFKILNIVEADMNESIETYAWVENSDLFQVGQTLNDNVYPNYMWYDNTPLGYTIQVQALTVEGAQILIIEE